MATRRIEPDSKSRVMTALGSGVRWLPRGYRGAGHETIGTDILALVDAIIMPEQVLGTELYARLRSLKPGGWYAVEELLGPLELVANRLGPDSMRKIGWTLFKLSHEASVIANCKSVRDIVYGMDALYHKSNRGEAIGGWTVLEFEPGRTLLEKTTPHHCLVEEGILEAGVRTLGVHATISQPSCIRDGGETCQVLITSHTTDARWVG